MLTDSANGKLELILSRKHADASHPEQAQFDVIIPQGSKTQQLNNFPAVQMLCYAQFCSEFRRLALL